MFDMDEFTDKSDPLGKQRSRMMKEGRGGGGGVVGMCKVNILY